MGFENLTLLDQLRNMKLGIVLPLLGLTVAATAQVSAPGAISGRIVFEDNGSPLPGATMTAYWIDERFGGREPRVLAQAYADASGAYTLTGLRAGEYLLCPDAIGSDLINPCSWAMPTETVRVAAGQTVTGVDRAIARGRLIEVEVDDPGELLDQNEVAGRGVHLLAGVWGPDKRFHTARITKSDKKSRTYAVAVPFDTPVSLDVRGRKLDLEDDKGRAKKEDDAPVALTAARTSSRASVKVVVKVKGVKP